MPTSHELISGDRLVKIHNTAYAGYCLQLYVRGIYAAKAYTGRNYAFTKSLAEKLVRS